MVCTREAYLAREASGGSPMPGGSVCLCSSGEGKEHALPLALAVAVVVSGWKRACLYATPRVGSLSLNTGSVSGGLRSVRPWLAVFLPAGRCVELGSAVYPPALSLAVRSLAGCTADLAADDRSVSACLCGL